MIIRGHNFIVNHYFKYKVDNEYKKSTAVTITAVLRGAFLHPACKNTAFIEYLILGGESLIQ